MLEYIFEELMVECYKEPTQRQRTKHSTRFEKVFFKNKKYILNYVTDIVGIIGYWLIYDKHFVLTQPVIINYLV